MHDAQDQENFNREYDRNKRTARHQARRALMAVAGPSHSIEVDPGPPASGQAAPIGSPSSDGHNVMEFDPGNEGVPSPVLSDASMAITPEMQALPAEQEPWRCRNNNTERNKEMLLTVSKKL
ncbi:uncharacterized protein F5891DRAFT_1184875 [Suillus fuscotomentosus]|uniref:Uncharacterized protein n=1 Tax=Suillus fuscotomentosus TaxID=1912939 RepID=A0AAD4EFD8_9AGAM|nr:uncharacterized protein F5891DRAFT_1184875 [Suillus fuscotomentosus]KAG1903933.1 hypothetical protein F5891DRAFT_1184875 [Suillus fuscotomentosus]